MKRNHLREREEKNMCKKIKEIHNLSPAKIREQYWKNLISPIDMVSLLRKMEIACVSVDFERLETNLKQNKGNIHGLAYSDKDDLGILYATDSPKQDNYVLAHELAHCCLHLPVSAEFHVELNANEDIYVPAHRSRFRKKAYENEADAFATELLIPTNSLLMQLAETKTPTVKALSDYYIVPKILVQRKLNTLVK